jgi:hypothetical protein
MRQSMSCGCYYVIFNKVHTAKRKLNIFTINECYIAVDMLYCIVLCILIDLIMCLLA